jgi:hypothetical protein
MNKHIDDTRYVQWEDGMYVMLDDLECEYEMALIEDSLRSSFYFRGEFCFCYCFSDVCYGVRGRMAGLWTGADGTHLKSKLTRAQALYIATGETTCTTY